MKVLEIYKELCKGYGQQGWWPTTPENSINPKYHPGNELRKLSDKEKIEIIFGAILTQNTSWKNVEKAIVNLNQKKMIDIDRVIEAEEKDLAELIKASGYYNQKAKKLKHMAKFLKENGLRKLEHMDIQELRQMLLSVNGVGKETADSIILYAFQKPIFVIDAYTRRIFSRLGLCDEDVEYDELQKFIAEGLDEDVLVYNQFHALIVEHAKRNCRKKQECDGCVLKCKSFK